MCDFYFHCPNPRRSYFIWSMFQNCNHRSRCRSLLFVVVVIVFAIDIVGVIIGIDVVCVNVVIEDLGTIAAFFIIFNSIIVNIIGVIYINGVFGFNTVIII